jgi:DnaJ homolog subfamily B member 12
LSFVFSFRAPHRCSRCARARPPSLSPNPVSHPFPKTHTKTHTHTKQITTVLEARCYYAVLAVPRSASEEDIKRSYRKLALRLHPDKCGAPRAPDAFRAVSRAFACLSDPGKRRAYDRSGVDPDDPAVGAGRGGFPGGGAGPRRRAGAPGAGGFYGPGGPAFPDGFDPEEIFNAFFGMGGGFGPMGGGFGPFGGGGPWGDVRFGGGGGGPGRTAHRRAGRPAPDEPAPAAPWAALLAQLAPLLLLLLLAILPGGSDDPTSASGGAGVGLASPPVSLDRRPPLYGVRLETPPPARVPFFVSSSRAFDAAFPPGSRGRARIEGAAEEAYRDRLVRACGAEKRAAARAAAGRGGGGWSSGGGGGLFGWGRPETADAYELDADAAPACEELGRRFGK